MDDLTPEWLTRVLREAEVLDGAVDVRAARPEVFGTGQFGLVIRTRLEYDGPAPDAPESVIVKLASLDPGSRGLAMAIGAYEAEVHFYREIAPLVDVALPRCLWAGLDSAAEQCTIVLEDLSDACIVGDNVRGGSVEQAGLAIEQLVKLQAPVWDDPRLRKLDWLADPGRTALLFAAVPQALPIFRDRFAGRCDPAHLDLAERLAPLAGRFPAVLAAGPQVVAHGDFRLDNLLFSTPPQPPAATVIDWQLARLASPLLDVAIYLAACLPPDVRRTHQHELLRAYHEGLVAAGVRGFSWASCREGLRRCSLYSFLLSIGVIVSLEATERGDAMALGIFAQSAEFVLDLNAADVLDP
jgi:hypothetical protein